MPPEVWVYKSETYEDVPDVMERIFDECELDVSGKKVLLKPNMLGPMPPESNVCTHPAVIRSAVEAIERRGAAEIIVGDNPGMRAYGSNVRAAEISGIYGAAKGRFVNIAENPVNVPTQSRFASSLLVSREVLDADVFISLPKMKTHVATRITGGLKNSYGILVGGQKTSLHRLARGPVNFAEAVLDAFQIRPPDLVILDAVHGMEGQGPSGGQSRHIGRLIASSNAAALDVVMTRMMNLEPAEIPLLRLANERGIGPIDISEIDVRGPFEVISDFKAPKIGMGMGTVASRLITYLIVTQPRADRKVCVRCGACEEICPVDAVTMKPFPVIDKSTCISCFCCHELCKYKAMQITRRMRFFQKAKY
ncbi:MAG: DUF362 domain-containing protein [Planctomycetia bacterium]|nr:DUF362 domain-containing protein [Planctomycetia bacterium]